MGLSRPPSQPRAQRASCAGGFGSMSILFFRAWCWPHRFPSFDRHSAVRLELIMRDHVGDLVADGLDLALRFGDPPGGSLIARKLVETRILTVASPEFVARYGRLKHPSEIEKLRCIDFYDAANARPFDWEFRQGRKILPVKPSARLMVSDVGAMLSACEAGVGIAQIMALGSGHLLAEGKLIELFPDWPGEVFPLYALYPSRQLRAAKVRTFIEFTSDLLVNRKPPVTLSITHNLSPDDSAQLDVREA